jgi:uncharacterized membrane protein YhaH (DUF805 family)
VPEKCTTASGSSFTLSQLHHPNPERVPPQWPLGPGPLHRGFQVTALVQLGGIPGRVPFRTRKIGKSVNFSKAVKSFWSHYARFTGRSRRSEYWFIQLFLVLTNIAVGVIDLILMDGDVDRFIVPALAVLVRRLHDIGRSGWWALIGFVPIVGAIVLLVFTVSDSAPGENKYGLSPKE